MTTCKHKLILSEALSSTVLGLRVCDLDVFLAIDLKVAHVMVHVFDGLLVVQTRLSVVFHLHHN